MAMPSLSICRDTKYLIHSHERDNTTKYPDSKQQIAVRLKQHKPYPVRLILSKKYLR